LYDLGKEFVHRKRSLGFGLSSIKLNCPSGGGITRSESAGSEFSSRRQAHIVSSKPSRPKNALVHGLYASDLVLPWENEQDFLDLHAAIREELSPDGSLEDMAVLDISRLHWIKRRLNVGSQLAYDRHPDRAAMSKAAEDGWPGMRNYVRKAADDQDRISDQVRDVAKAQVIAAKNLFDLISKRTAQMLAEPANNKPKARQPRYSYEEDVEETVSPEIQWLTELSKTIKLFGAENAALLRHLENSDIEQSIFERAYRPDIMERTMKVESQIDKQIEKGLSRLANLKEFKRIYGKKDLPGRRIDLIDGPST
jgi:hypothetical protein